MARVIDFTGGQRRAPLRADQIRSIQLSELLRSGNGLNRPIVSGNQVGVELASEALRNFGLAREREALQAREDAAGENIKEALGRRLSDGFSINFPKNQPGPEIPATSERFAEQIPQGAGPLSERLSLAREINADTQNALADQRPIANLATSGADRRLQDQGLPPLTRASTTDERVNILSQNKDNLPLALQLQLQQDAAKQAAGVRAQEQKFLLKIASAKSGSSLSPLGKLQRERGALDPLKDKSKIDEINKQIGKLSTNTPLVNISNKEQSEEDKIIGKGRGEAFNAGREASLNAQDQNFELEALSKIDLNTGPGTDFKATLAEIGTAFGFTDEKINKFIGNAQKFRSIIALQVNKELNKAKGPQTEGDAQRAKDTLANLGNTPQANRFIVNLTRAKNNRVIARHNFQDKFKEDRGTLKGVDKAWRESPENAKSLFDDPVLAEFKDDKSPQLSVDDFLRKKGIN
jgi:hypothetical protein